MSTESDFPQPPRFAHWLLSALHPAETREEVEGDLAELYACWYEKEGKRPAQLRYLWSVLSVLPPFVKKRAAKPAYPPQTLHLAMLRNYFTVAWRNSLRNKGYSFINIGGLSVGLTVALLIGLWVHHEYSYDRFLPDGERLYQVRRNFNSNGDTLNFTTVSLKLANVLREQIPEMEYVAESSYMRDAGITVEDEKFYVRGGHVGSDFLKMFRYPLLAGSAGSVLKEPYSIVLTESKAKTLFGTANAVGKTLRFDKQSDLTVTGILKDIPSNSSLQFDFLLQYEQIQYKQKNVKINLTAAIEPNHFKILIYNK